MIDTLLYCVVKCLANRLKNKSLENGEKISKQVLQSKKRCLDIMAKYFYINTCRRRFILEYFGQIPKFFCCNNCDNCCERELVDYTHKIKKVIFHKKTWEKTFNKEELDVLQKNNLIKLYYKKYRPTKTLNNWEKLLTINNKVTKTPKKYRIKLKSI